MTEIDHRSFEITCLMASTLEEGLSRLRERALEIQELSRWCSLGSTSFHTEWLGASLEGDEWLPVFFKDLNPHHQIEEAKEVREADINRSRRELLMYRLILSRADFGTPELYAFRWEPDRGILWLFLEDVGTLRLNSCPDLARWVGAAKWAARFHAAVRYYPASQIDFLPSMDRSHYSQCAERIQRKLPELEAGDRQLIGQALEAYIPRIEWLSSLPRNVIHGELFGKNIMLRLGCPDRLIAVIDWESAAIGPGTLDLVTLTSGQWSAEQRQLMWQAYFEEYQTNTGLHLDWETFCHELHGMALYQVLTWLGWWLAHSSSHHFCRLMEELKGVLNDYFPAYKEDAATSSLELSRFDTRSQIQL